MVSLEKTHDWVTIYSHDEEVGLEDRVGEPSWRDSVYGRHGIIHAA